MLMSDLRRDYIMTRLTPAISGGEGLVTAALRELEQHAQKEYEADGFSAGAVLFERYANLRYFGQEHTVKVKLPGSILSAAALHTVVEDFRDVYDRDRKSTRMNSRHECATRMPSYA